MNMLAVLLLVELQCQKFGIKCAPSYFLSISRMCRFLILSIFRTSSCICIQLGLGNQMLLLFPDGMC